MSRLEDALAGIAALLDRDQYPWALLGGLAVSTYVEPRFTRDIDLAVAVLTDERAEAFVRDIRSRGYSVTMISEQDSQERLASVRLVPPGETPEGVVIDIMFASSGIEDEICRDAQVLEVFAEVAVPVCRPGHLLALKLLARDDRLRPQDLGDIRLLLAIAEEDDLSRARRGIAQITERGYNRGRDLAAELELLLEQARDSGVSSA